MPIYIILFGACICIALLLIVRRQPPTKQKIKEIWHGHVYWDDNNTILTPNLRSDLPMNETAKEVRRSEPLREVTIKTTTRKIDLPSDKKSIVMIDNRHFSYWQPTLNSAIKYTSNDWGIEIFVSKKYDQFALVKKFLDSTGRRTRLNHYDMHFNKKHKHRSINSLLKQETFWETIEAESIFFIQPDGVVCRNGIDEFLKYDYVGAPWSHRPDGLVQGNGGMSLRKRSFMLDCLKNYHKHDNDPEDVYFSNCAKDRGVSADLANSKRFGMEAIWSKDSITIHQLYFNPKLTLGRTKAKVFEDICAQCPEIMEIPYFKARFDIVNDLPTPLLNILTRTTSSRYKQFVKLSKSIQKQTTTARHIISSEDDKTEYNMNDIFFVEHENRGAGCHKQVSLSAGKGCCPYNKHLNVLKNQVKKGWVLILDDDSLILSDTFVERLTNHLEKTKRNKIVVFPVKYGPNNRKLPAAHHIKFGDIDMANFVVHISNIRDYRFTSDCGGDFRFLKHLMQKGLKVDWFDMKVAIHANTNGAQQGVLTSSQECPCYEQRIDKLGVVGIDRRPAKFKGLFERHRMVCAVFKHKLTPNGNWLYFGPEKTHISILRQKWPDVTFTGIDYFAKGYHYEKNTLQGDVQDLYNIKSNTYDGIIILHVLEHVASIKKSLSELHRILKPGGKIIHETPCQTNSKSFKCDGHRNYLICKQFDHYWGYNCNDLHRLFSQNFSCENIEFSDNLSKKYAIDVQSTQSDQLSTICTKNEKTTIVLMGYSTKRNQNYKNIFEAYGSMDSLIDKIIFIWNNVNEPTPTIPNKYTTEIQLIRSTKNSLNNRFNVSMFVKTRSILTIDDDILLSKDAISNLLNSYKGNPEVITGLFGRSYSEDGKYYYTIRPNLNKMALTGTAIFDTKYAIAYMENSKVMEFVDSEMNCEDIAMNFLVRYITKKEPIILSNAKWIHKLPEPDGLSLKPGWTGKRHKCISFMLNYYKNNKK